jgi:hypothetical protein
MTQRNLELVVNSFLSRWPKLKPKEQPAAKEMVLKMLRAMKHENRECYLAGLSILDHDAHERVMNIWQEAER